MTNTSLEASAFEQVHIYNLKLITNESKDSAMMPSTDHLLESWQEDE